jgi:hypothetical protein
VKKYLVWVYLGILVIAAGLQLNYALRTDLFFSQDDFLIFSYTARHTYLQTIGDFIKTGELYVPRRMIGYIIGYLNMKEIYDLFGANPLPFIIWNHIIHTANMLMLFAALTLITKRKFPAFLAALLFNRYYIFCFSNIHEYLVVFFSLVSILTFIKWPKRILISVTAFIAALLSKEYGVVLPVFLTYIAWWYKPELKRNLRPFWIVLGIYMAMQLIYFLNTQGTNVNPTYTVSLTPENMWYSFTQYFKWPYFAGLAAIPLLTKKRNSWTILMLVLATLFPALILTNRHDPYYLYLPGMWLMIYIALNLPKTVGKMTAAVIVIIFLLGGRQAFPIIARQNYPNWQKMSMMNVLNRVQETMQKNPETKTIDIADVNLERDARSMLQYNTLNMFLRKPIKDKYEYHFDYGTKIIEVSAY